MQPMADPRLEKLADLLVGHSLRLGKGDLLMVLGAEAALPLVKAVYRAALRAGAHPHYMPVLPGYAEAADAHVLTEILLEEAGNEQLRFVSPVSELVLGRFDAVLRIRSAANVRALSRIDPARKALRGRATSGLFGKLLHRSEDGSLRWCVPTFPTEGLAQEASMSLDEYAAFVFRACRLDGPDPAAAWRAVSREQEELIRRIRGFRRLRVTAEDTELEMSVEGRTWVNGDGRLNMPDGELFTAPVEDSVEGRIRFSFPGIASGQEVEDIRLTFREGRVTEASASRGAGLLEALLATDEGARRVGELGIGTNPLIDRFSRSMVFDEKIGGTLHLAVGNSPPFCGGRNRSGIHWDMLCDLRSGGEIHGDGELIFREGRFLL